MTNCPRCGTKLSSDWNFCPRCGYKKGEGFCSLFDNVFSRIRREMREMDKSFQKEFEAFDLSPWFKTLSKEELKEIRKQKPPMNRKGFSIRIIRTGGQKPRISVKTYGNVEKEKVMDEIIKQIGSKRQQKKLMFGFLKQRTPKEKPSGIFFKKEIPEKREKPLPTPRFTEEPKTDIRRLDSRVVVDMDVPGVKSLNDVEIKELENSIEVKAIAGDKAYFKILTKPEQFRITNKEFKDGRLHLEFA